ncbi:hypothetical protein ASD82_02145 [Rhodanobacter sp. Root179]|nr:hypothetical protein ASD82_02145 [Rhodanobacter sp. Root179]
MVDQASAVVEQTVHAGAQIAVRCNADVEGAIQRQVAFHVDEVAELASTRDSRAKAVIKRRSGRKVEIAIDGKRADSTFVARRQGGAIGYGDIAAQGALAAQGGALGYGRCTDSGRLVTVYKQAARGDFGGAGIAILAGEG